MGIHVNAYAAMASALELDKVYMYQHLLMHYSRYIFNEKNHVYTGNTDKLGKKLNPIRTI